MELKKYASILFSNLFSKIKVSAAAVSVMFFVAIGVNTPLHAQNSSQNPLDIIMMVGELLQRASASSVSKHELLIDDTPATVAVEGLDDSAEAEATASALTKALIAQNVEEMLRLIETHELSLKEKQLQDGSLVFVRTKTAIDSQASLPDLYTILFKDNLPQLQQLLASDDVNLNERLKEGEKVLDVTPLMFATQLKRSAMVDVLLANGADPDVQPTDRFWTAMGLAIDRANYEITKKLLDAGAKIPDWAGFTSWDTPLSIAVVEGDIDYVRLLLSYDAGTYGGNGNWTPIMHAIRLGKTDMIDLLADVGDPRIKAEPIKGGYVQGSVKYVEEDWFPEANALFMARYFSDHGLDDLETRLLNNVEKRAGPNSRHTLNISALLSASQLAESKQDQASAWQSMNDAWSVFSLINLTDQAEDRKLNENELATLSEYLTRFKQLSMASSQSLPAGFDQRQELLTKLTGDQ